ncbi:MAG: AsmA-like C-terminal region-containing protein, partial [Myxococcota bacterium]
ADAFALDGWDKLVPPLGLVKPTGRIAIPRLALSTDPLAVRGEIALDDLVATPPDRAPIVLRGAIQLLGTELRTRDLVARAADQPIRVDASVTQLFEAPRYEVSFETKGADTNALLAGYANQPDRLMGPLDLKGTLRGTTTGENSPLDALSGDIALDIEGGRIVGATLLEAALGSFGARVNEAMRQQGGKDWERFTTDRFSSLLGTLHIENGQLVTSPIELTYPDWGAELEGPIRLADLGLDLTGRITIGAALDAALARAFGARNEYVPEKRTIDLASVRGQLGAPKVQLAGKSIANIAAAYAGQIQTDELKKRLEKELGPGSGELVDQGLEALKGVLGGKKQ